MSVTSGFFNSFNGDRRYNAEQMSAIFNGIINDGVFASVGTVFKVNAGSGVDITVGTGRAWFNSTWLVNDAILPLSCDISEIVLDRIDAVVIEIDRSESVRAGSIKIIKGTPASAPQRPTMASTDDVHQYPLAYIYRKAGSGEITQSNITNMVGTSACPYITGILQVVNIDNVVAQWEDQWDQWFTTQTEANEGEAAQWMIEMQAEFDAWFANLDVTLEGDVAANFANQILELQERFETLAREQSVYDKLEDSSGDFIEDSYGSIIEGRTALYSGDSPGGIDESTLQKLEERIDAKQDKVSGGTNQTVGFNNDGDMIVVDIIRPKSVKITLTVEGWSDLTQTVAVPGISANEDSQYVDIVPASTSKSNWNEYGLDVGAFAANSLTFTATKKPEQAIAVYVVMQEVIS